ncbi:MAG: type III pantothenate kinase [Coriobacteriia bacterium]|nr:type III pantothenate kinase [Coriobacteriia bacterium]
MLLTIDIGNTQSTFGVYASDELQATWRISTRAGATPDELLVLLGALLSARALALPDIKAVCLGSVVPELTRAWIGACAAAELPVPLLPAQIAPRDLGLTSAQAGVVGADRLANAVAARARYGAPAVVVDFGTATNLDVIDGEGHFIGGPISAGLELSAEALYAQAARLAAVELAAPSRIIAQTTEDALRAGLVVGEAAKVDGLVIRIAEELADSSGPADRMGSGTVLSFDDKTVPDPILSAGLLTGLPVVATGGLAPLIAPHSWTITTCDTSLTLDGLHLLARDALRGEQA